VWVYVVYARVPVCPHELSWVLWVRMSVYEMQGSAGVLGLARERVSEVGVGKIVAVFFLLSDVILNFCT
jgi:hypothetical protein